jgi:hypothetical protein
MRIFRNKIKRRYSEVEGTSKFHKDEKFLSNKEI